MPNVSHKHEFASFIATKAEGGVIVEIGVNKGNGMIALWDGSKSGRRVPVYGIDPFLSWRDDFGTEYTPDNYSVAVEAIKQAGINNHAFILREDAIALAPQWTDPVALLWLDLGAAGDLPRRILKAWHDRVIPGGHVCVAGAEHPGLDALGTASVLLETGDYDRVFDDQDKVICLRKKTPRRAVFYIVGGNDRDRFAWEADRSAGSVKRHMPQLETFMFLEGGELHDATKNMDHILPLPDRQGPFWYLDSTRYFVHAVSQMPTVGQFMYMDTDTFVCMPCDEIFTLLNNFDMALGHEPQRDAIDSALGTPAPFSTLGIGVNVFRNSTAVRDTLADWLERYEKLWNLYDNNDQAPLRDVLWQNKRGLKWYVLPPEYSLRFDFGCWVVGKVRILHGRVGGYSQEPLQPVADAINAHGRMRIWNHGLL